jgi:RNA polymerase sigma-70 factor (ECF subfamily)
VEELERRLHSLMIATLAGDGGAYRTLLEELRRHLQRYFRHRLGKTGGADADDLVQDILMAVHTKRATYDAGRPFTAWVHAIARYRLIDHLRRRRRAGATMPIEDAADLFRDDGSETATRLDVDRLLATLPEGSRTLVRRVKLEGHSVADVAAAAGMSESAVKVSVHRSIRRLALRVQGKAAP